LRWAPISRLGCCAPSCGGPWSRLPARSWLGSPRSTRQKSPCAPTTIRSGGGGRSSQSKILVAGAVEVADGAPGRIRLATIEDFSAASLHGFVAANLAQGATIKTDGWAAYPGAPNVAHDPHVVGNMAAHIVLPWIHRVFSNLKTWALGVYHGLRRKHLQSYLDEFVFRFNRRRTRHAAFRSLLSIGLITKPITYEMLVRPESAA